MGASQMEDQAGGREGAVLKASVIFQSLKLTKGLGVQYQLC